MKELLTCAGCRHWVPPPPLVIHGPTPRTEADLTSKGRCQLPYSRGESVELETDGTFAVLMTAPHYGCLWWETKGP